MLFCSVSVIEYVKKKKYIKACKQFCSEVLFDILWVKKTRIYLKSLLFIKYFRKILTDCKTKFYICYIFFCFFIWLKLYLSTKNTINIRNKLKIITDIIFIKYS